MKEKLTAWSLKVAEFEHQFKVIHEAQKTFVVGEIMPKDIQREFWTGTEETRRNNGKVGDHHQSYDDGPVPMDLENASTEDARTMQSD